MSYDEIVEFDMGTIYDDAGEDSTNIENIKEAYLEVFLTNSYAFETTVQCYLLDDNSVVIDSLFSKGPTTIKGAESKDDPKDIRPKETSFKISVSGEKIQKWRRVKKAQITVGASTVGDDFNKFYAGQEMSFILGLYVTGIYENEEL